MRAGCGGRLDDRVKEFDARIEESPGGRRRAGGCRRFRASGR